MKLLVYFFLALEVAQTIMVTRDTYNVFATGFGNYIGLNDLHLLWLTLPILGGLGWVPFGVYPAADINF